MVKLTTSISEQMRVGRLQTIMLSTFIASEEWQMIDLPFNKFERKDGQRDFGFKTCDPKKN